MSLEIRVPGARRLLLEHLVLDVNGTLTERGQLIPGVRTEIRALCDVLSVHLATADTFGTAARVVDELGATLHRISTGEEKRTLVEKLGMDATVAVGNGLNDVPMLRAAALGIAVLGPEGAGAATLAAADVVTGSIASALSLLRDPLALTATLRP